MRKAEQKEFFKKLTVFLAKKLQILNLEGWTDQEISSKTEISNNRLSEIKNHEKYHRIINRKILIAFIAEGFVTVNEIKEKVALSKSEINHLDEMKILEKGKAFVADIVNAEESGIDVRALIKAERERLAKK